MYGTAQDVRDLLGITIDDADDSILEEFLDKAQRVILHYIQVEVHDEEMTGNINGTNNTFVAKHPWPADTNFDKVIDTSDFKIYGWTKASDPSTKVELSVSTFYPQFAKFVLTEAPSTTYKKITIDYSYYTKAIDWDLVSLATCYYAGMLWVARELYLVPEDLTIGNVRVRNRQPWERLREEFLRIVFHLTKLPMDKVSYEKIMRSPRRPWKYKGPGTTYEVEIKSSSKYIKSVT